MFYQPWCKTFFKLWKRCLSGDPDMNVLGLNSNHFRCRDKVSENPISKASLTQRRTNGLWSESWTW